MKDHLVLKTLREVATSDKFAIVDGPFGTQLHASEYQDEGIPVVRVVNTTYDGHFDSSRLVFISEQKAAKLRRSIVYPGDVIVAKTGATIGKTGIFPESFDCGIIASSCLKVSVDKIKADNHFVAYLLQSADGQNKIIDAAGGSTRTTINTGPFGDISFLYPPIEEQTQIATILSTLDRAIEQTEEIIAKQQRIKAGLMQDLLTKGIDDHGVIRSEATHQFKDSPLGRIPVEWEVAPLGEMAVVDRGKFTHRPRNDPRFYGGDLPFIQTGDITANIGRWISEYSQTLNSKGAKVSKEFPRGTIAITIAANIADTAILGIPMYFPDSVVGAVVDEPNNLRFVELAIRKIKSSLDALAPQSAQKNINLEVLRPLLLPKPSPEEQLRIAQTYETIDSQMIATEKAKEKLQRNKTGLMHDLLNGTVRVSIP